VQRRFYRCSYAFLRAREMSVKQNDDIARFRMRRRRRRRYYFHGKSTGSIAQGDIVAASGDVRERQLTDGVFPLLLVSEESAAEPTAVLQK
jgi:hypothetical protein